MPRSYRLLRFHEAHCSEDERLQLQHSNHQRVAQVVIPGPCETHRPLVTLPTLRAGSKRRVSIHVGGICPPYPLTRLPFLPIHRAVLPGLAAYNSLVTRTIVARTVSFGQEM